MSDDALFKTSQAKAVAGAIVGGLTAALSALAGQLADGKTLAQIPTVGWIAVIVALLSGSGLTHLSVYAVPNDVKPTAAMREVDAATDVGVPASTSESTAAADADRPVSDSEMEHPSDYLRTVLASNPEAPETPIFDSLDTH